MNLDCVWSMCRRTVNIDQHKVIESGVLNNQYINLLFSMHKWACKCCDTHFVSAMLLRLSSKKHISPHLLLIRIILFMTRPAWSTDWYHASLSHKEEHSSASPPPRLNISLFSHMQSNRVETAKAEGPAAEDHIPVPQWAECYCLIAMLQVLVHLALKGNGRWSSDWFNICSAWKHTHV